MANHFRVSPKYWLHARKHGWGDQETLLGLYVLTCEHRNLEGLYRLPKPYIGADLNWSARTVEVTLGALCGYGFVQYDEASQVILIPKALKHQAPSTDNQIKGAIAQLERIPRTSLWDAFRIACESHCPKLADAISMRWPSHSNGSSRARAGARAPASSSNSSSSSNHPLSPPPGGNRKTDIAKWEDGFVAWAASVGVTGRSDVVVKAGRQFAPWRHPRVEDFDPATAFSDFCREMFPSLSVVHPLPTGERAA